MARRRTIREIAKDAIGRGPIRVKGQDDSFIKELKNTNEFLEFFKKENHKLNAERYRYEQKLKTVSKREAQSNVINSKKSVKRAVQAATGVRNVEVDVSDDSKDWTGDLNVKPKSGKQEIKKRLEEKKDTIVSNQTISDDRLVQIASRKDTKQYLDVIKGFEYEDNKQKADAIRNYIASRNMVTGKSNKGNAYATAIVLEAAKESPNLTENMKKDYGRANYEELEKTFARNVSSPSTEIQIRHKAIKKEYGKPGTPSMRIFKRIQAEHNLNEIDTSKYLKTAAGKTEFEHKIIEEFKAGKGKTIKKHELNRALEKHGFGKKAWDDTKLPKRYTDFEQKVNVGRDIFGFTGKTSAGTADISKFTYNKIAQNPEALKAMREGKDFTQYAPKSISYNELREFVGKEPKLQQLKRAQANGIEITGAPPDIEAKLSGVTVTGKPSTSKKEFMFGKTSTGGGRGAPSGGGRTKASYAKGGSLLSEEEIYYSKGRAYTRKKQGRIAASLSRARKRVPGLRSAEEKEQARSEKQRKYQKRVEKIYEELKKRKDLQYLTPEEQWEAASSDPAKRRLIIRKGRHMYFDKSYRDKQIAKREEKEGLQAARLTRAQRLSKQRMRAAASPFWRAWYWISHNTFLFLGILIAVAILFIPVGLFYVVGWALAVGMASLVMFIIWVFMEFWWFIAQGLVAVINLIGQAIVNVINWIGGGIAGALGMEFTPFEHTLVQNMGIAERDPITGERRILGITWGEWNLVPPDFMKLDEFMPREFDTDVIITKLWPAISGFFEWYTKPIADRYTEWISEAEWWVVGATIGIPIVLIIIAVAIGLLYIRRKMI